MEKNFHDFPQCQLNPYKTKQHCDVTELVILKKSYISFGGPKKCSNVKSRYTHLPETEKCPI